MEMAEAKKTAMNVSSTKPIGRPIHFEKNTKVLDYDETMDLKTNSFDRVYNVTLSI